MTLPAATYLEFEYVVTSTGHLAHVYQIFLMPPVASTGDPIAPQLPGKIYSRTISSYRKKPRWETAVNALSAETESGITLSTFYYSIQAFMREPNWRLRMEPIIAELSDEDVEMHKRGDVPYPLIGRILRARRALGFPEKLFEDS